MRIIIFIGLLLTFIQTAQAHGIPAEYIAQIKRSEGYHPEAYWDVRQWSIGWGTKSQSGEVIDEKEAERRFFAEMSAAASFVDSVNPALDPGTRAALSSLTFNAGQGWGSAGLGDAVRAGDLGSARPLFLRYIHAGGRELSGLVSRRGREVAWFNTYRRECRLPDGQVGWMR